MWNSAGKQNVSWICREQRATEVGGPDTKTRDEVGNQPTCVHDCYSSYQLSAPTHRKCDYVTWVAGSDVTVDGAMATTPDSHVTSSHGADTETNDTNLSTSHTLYHPHISSVTTWRIYLVSK